MNKHTSRKGLPEKKTRKKRITLKDRKHAIAAEMTKQAASSSSVDINEDTMVAAGLLKHGAVGEAEIQAALTKHAKTKRLPLKVKCNSCGGEKFCFNVWPERIKEYGSFESVLRGFKCRGCSKNTKIVLKQAKRAVKAAAKEAKEELIYSVPVFVQSPRIIYDLTLKENEELAAHCTATQCFRPDIVLNNSRSCEGCALYANCHCPIKCLKGASSNGGKKSYYLLKKEREAAEAAVV